jgi:hypothetical protein
MNKFELNSQLLKITKANFEGEKLANEIEELINLCTLIHSWSANFDRYIKTDKESVLRKYIFYINEFGVKSDLKKDFDERRDVDGITVQYEITYKGDDVYELKNMME